MKKKNFILLITLIVIFVAAWLAGLFFIERLDVKIFSAIVFATIFIGQRYTLIKLKPVNIRLMWSLLSADLYLYLCGINIFLSFITTFLVIEIFMYAPRIGSFLGFNDFESVTDWDGTITDEGEVVGEYKKFYKNRIISPVVFLLLFYFFYFVCY